MPKTNEVIKLGEVDMPPKRKAKVLTRKGLMNQVRNMKRAQGTENEWGPEALSRLKAKAESIGITLEA
jgi:hypothetical protein|tara:strand:- start:81 stop:284 length:204 start_codon:yes stop_codon:yes gene_type:complete